MKYLLVIFSIPVLLGVLIAVILLRLYKFDSTKLRIRLYMQWFWCWFLSIWLIVLYMSGWSLLDVTAGFTGGLIASGVSLMYFRKNLRKHLEGQFFYYSSNIYYRLLGVVIVCWVIGMNISSEFISEMFDRNGWFVFGLLVYLLFYPLLCLFHLRRVENQMNVEIIEKRSRPTESYE